MEGVAGALVSMLTLEDAFGKPVNLKPCLAQNVFKLLLCTIAVGHVGETELFCFLLRC